MPGYIYGLEYNQAADADHDITVEMGYTRNSANSANIDLGTAMTKQLDATWATGDNVGGLFSGTVQADTIYHIL